MEVNNRNVGNFFPVKRQQVDLCRCGTGMLLAVASKAGDHLLVGFNLALSLVAKHLFHEIKVVDQAPHVGVLDEGGIRGLPLHLVLVDGLHCVLLERMEQQLHTHARTFIL